MTTKDCIFCRIVAGEIPSQPVYQDKEAIAIRDLYPKAPTHILVLPRRHIASLADTQEADAPLLGRLVALVARLAREQGLSEKGYRLVVNSGPWSGQEVPHLHLHLMGGRQLTGLG